MGLTLNITAGNDKKVVLWLLNGLHDDGREPFPVELSEDVAVKMVSEVGTRHAVSFVVGDEGRVLLDLKGSDYKIGLWGIEVVGRLNGAKWRAYGDSMIQYTPTTERGAELVTDFGDADELTLVVGYATDIVPRKTSELVNDGEDGEHPFVSEEDLAAVATSGSYNDLKDKPSMNFIPTALKGAKNGVAELNAEGKVPTAQAQFALRGNLVAADIDSTALQSGFYRVIGQRLGADILGGDEANGVLIQYSDGYKEQVLHVGRTAGASAGEQVETYTRRYLPTPKRWTAWHRLDEPAPSNYYTKQQTDGLLSGKAGTEDVDALQQQVAGKQDAIADLADIRSGAVAGATALQHVTALDAEVVKTSGNQTIAGQKVFGGIVGSSNVLHDMTKSINIWSSAVKNLVIYTNFTFATGVPPMVTLRGRKWSDAVIDIDLTWYCISNGFYGNDVAYFARLPFPYSIYLFSYDDNGTNRIAIGISGDLQYLSLVADLWIKYNMKSSSFTEKWRIATDTTTYTDETPLEERLIPPVGTDKCVQVTEKKSYANVAYTGSYNDLANKPTIPVMPDLTPYALKSELPVVPTNVSAFTNDAGYLTQHQDISGKEDKMQVVGVPSGETSLAAQAGEYYAFADYLVTFDITLPMLTDVTTVQTIVFYMTMGSAPAVTFTSEQPIYYHDGFSLEAGKTYEVNALWNGAAWVIASVEINVGG